ncbi:hypothetical protein F5Y06DRAFT_207442 [Hypoxylon sp. FL0890]|nr:hypothetical protein F5Y06DRAFT_207442 [Hypoxylon sp. FL0890]
MEHPNKRSKPNDYHERGDTSEFAVPHEHVEGSQSGSRGLTEHSGQGVLNRDGNFHNGGNFDASHYHHNSHVLIQPTFVSRSPDGSNPIITKEERRRDLLQSLNFAQIDARRTSIKSAHRKTCKWFLKTAQYREWLDTAEFDKHGGFLWIKGKPGAGKSTLMKYAFSHVHRTLRKRGIIVVSFFFNARGEELEKSTVGLYRSLLFQLLEEHADLQHVLDSIRPGHQWNTESLKSLIEEVVCAMKDVALVCFIDALDECEEQEVRDMLSFLQTVSEEAAASSSAKLHVCFASRHYPHITIEKGLNLVIERREEHQQDIADYLNTELHIGHDRLAEQIRSELQDKASGVFMWVVLVVDILNKEYDRGRKYRLRQRLKDIPGDLHELFHDILTRDHDNTRGLLLCIQWVLFARRPLTPEELYFAIMSGVEPDSLFSCDSGQEISPDDMRRYILDNSKGLAESTKSGTPTVQFIHESVRDFLLKENGLRKIWPELGSNLEGHSHDELKRCCLAYLRNRIVRNLNLNLPIPLPKASTPEAADLRREAAKSLPFLEYAHQNILHHADKAEGNGVSQKEFLSTFSLADWIVYNNLFEKWQIRRYTPEASLVYILAERNLPNLIRIQHSRQSCFTVEKERYGTAIFAALATQSNEATQALLEMQVKTLPLDSPLHDKCERFAKSEHIINRFSREFSFSSRKHLASYIFEKWDPVILEVLLSTENIDLGFEGTEGNSLLEIAILSGNESAVRILLDHGADIKASPQAQLLKYAVDKGYAMVELLLQRGADFKGKGVLVILRKAVLKGDEAILQLLLDWATDIDDNSMCALLDTAIHMGKGAIVPTLLRKGANINGNSAGNPLYTAVRWGREDIVQLLLDKGADPNIDTTNGYDEGNDNALLQAVRRGSCTIVRLLLDHRAQIECQDSSGRTPLLLAALFRNLEMVGLLLASGANIKAKDKYSRGALSLASTRKGNNAVIQLLLDHGACYD